MAGATGVWVWLALLVVAAAVALAIAAVALRNRSTPGAEWLGWLGALSGVWILTDVLGVVAPVEPLLVALEYLHLSFGTVAVALWLAFVLTYTGRLPADGGRWRPRLWLALAGVVAANAADPLHGLVYADLALETVDGVAVVKNVPGPLYLLQLLFVFGTYPLGLALLFRTVWAEDRLFTRQTLALLVGSLFPYAFGAVDVLDLEPVGWLPMVPVSITLLGVALAYAVMRAELLAVVPATRRIGEAEAFDALDDGVAVLAADGTVLRVNDAACRMFGRERDAVRGAPLAALVGAVSEDSGDLGATVDPGTLPATIERGGRVVEPRQAPIEGATGEVIGHTVLFRNVTEPRRREQRLEVLNRVLRHDLRNAVTVVDLNLEVLVDADDRDERAALARSVRSSLDDLDALGRKARVVERAIGSDAGAPERVALTDLLERVVADVRERTPDATVTLEVPDGAAVVTHRDRLAVALRNVLENAVVHADGPASATVTVTPDDGGVEVAVTDDGPGIPDHEIAVLEEGTETPLEHGSGLGLWLVHWATASLGGDVTFEAHGEGSTVRLWVPDAG